jgi:mono/diheme cytochrome c family protein
MTKIKIILLFAGLCATLFISACNLSLAADITPPPDIKPATDVPDTPEAVSKPSYPLVPPDPAAGEPVYTEKCAPCHGERGLGDGPSATDLPIPVVPVGKPEVARLSTPGQWYTIVTEGNMERMMPPFKSLSDRQRWDVVSYAFSLSTSQEDLSQGEAIYQSMCASCHGIDGKGDGEAAGALATQPPDFTDQEYMVSNSAAEFFEVIQKGIDPAMPGYDSTLSVEEIWQTTDYIRAFSFSPTLSEISQQSQSNESNPTSQSVSEKAEADTGTGENLIQGVVVNASGSELPEALEVEIGSFDHVNSPITVTVPLQDDGTFQTTELDILRENMYFASVSHEGVTFGSDLVIAESKEDPIDLRIQLYDVTTDTSGLYSDRLHLFIEPRGDGMVSVVELYVVSNPTNKAVAADSKKGYALEFDIPEGATNLSFQDSVLGERYIETENGFGDEIFILPGVGEHEVIFSYDLPYDGSLDLSHPVNLQTNAVVILIPEDGIKIRGEGLEDAGVRDIQGTPFHMYNRGPIQQGENLELTVTTAGSGLAGILDLGDNTGQAVGIGLLGAALVIAGIWLFRRSGEQEAADGESPIQELPDIPEGEETKEALLDAILALDDLYKDDQLDETAYLERRNDLKKRLKELLEETEQQE